MVQSNNPGLKSETSFVFLVFAEHLDDLAEIVIGNRRRLNHGHLTLALAVQRSLSLKLSLCDCLGIVCSRAVLVESGSACRELDLVVVLAVEFNK